VRGLSEMFKEPEASGVYLLEESHPAERLERLADELGLAFFHIDGRDIRTKNQFLEQASLALRFPEYFGNNWDAFADCLTDMSRHEADGFVILYEHFDSLAEHSPHQFETALAIFKESTEFWRTHGKALFVLLQGKNTRGSELPKASL
jgi:RNAse (barnase) inhibitor barstar